MEGAFCLSGAAVGAALMSLFVQGSRHKRLAEQEWFDDEDDLLDSEEETTDEESEDDSEYDSEYESEDEEEPLPKARTLYAQKAQQKSRKDIAVSDFLRNREVKQANMEKAEESADTDFCLGFSMQEARDHAETKANEAKERSPLEVLHGLQKGNTRFWMGMSSTTAENHFKRRALISMQYPSVAILGCSDSRVPTEIIFDQGLGDLFVVRVAGNCLDTAPMASLQYAVCHLKVKVLMVLGHEGCGAVKAAGLPLEKIEQEPEALSTALKGLKAGLDGDRLDCVSDTRARDREAVVSNVRAQIAGLSENGTVMSAIRRRELLVVGAFYEISSGIVDFFEEIVEVGDDGLELEPKEASFLRQISKSSFEVKSSKFDDVTGEKATEESPAGTMVSSPPSSKKSRITSTGTTSAGEFSRPDSSQSEAEEERSTKRHTYI